MLDCENGERAWVSKTKEDEVKVRGRGTFILGTRLGGTGTEALPLSGQHTSWSQAWRSNTKGDIFLFLHF